MKKVITLITLFISTITYAQSDGTDSCINLGHINTMPLPDYPHFTIVYPDSLTLPDVATYDVLDTSAWEFTPVEAVESYNTDYEVCAFLNTISANPGYDSIHVKYWARNGAMCSDTIEGDVFFNPADGTIDSARTAAAYARAMGWGSTNISNPVLNENIIIFPNPATDVLNISVKDLKYISTTIYDYTGKISLKTTRNQIPLYNIQPGIYFVKIETDKGAIHRKIIKH